MGFEIERKFVLDGPPDRLADAPSRPIEQGYLAIGADGTEVRLRRYGDRTLLTVKRGSGETRLEEEVDLAPDAFAALWPLTAGRRIQKRRFEIEAGGNVVEVDVYAGDLEGLIVAEVEFPTSEASAAFEPPAWIGREVTGEARYANQRLALEGL